MSRLKFSRIGVIIIRDVRDVRIELNDDFQDDNGDNKSRTWRTYTTANKRVIIRRYLECRQRFRRLREARRVYVNFILLAFHMPIECLHYTMSFM